MTWIAPGWPGQTSTRLEAYSASSEASRADLVRIAVTRRSWGRYQRQV